jgi:hypothetical protein
VRAVLVKVIVQATSSPAKTAALSKATETRILEAVW